MFRDICINDFKENIIQLISKEYMLICAGNKENYNMMTASWGFMGEMWGADCAQVVVRPQRYTMDFINENDYFTLCFFGDNKEFNKQVHKVCGTLSGRDADKTRLANLTPIGNDKYTYFGEARIVMVCKKKYVQPMKEECFTDKTVAERWYPQKDYHNIIIGEITRIYVSVKEPE